MPYWHIPHDGCAINNITLGKIEQHLKAQKQNRCVPKRLNEKTTKFKEVAQNIGLEIISIRQNSIIYR